MFGYSISVFGVSPSQLLRSKFILLSANLFQALHGEVATNNLGLLPMMNVNGEEGSLAEHLQKEMEEVIAIYPSLYLIPSEHVKVVWDELLKENLSEKELFQKIGEKLGISALVMSSLVTHSDVYSVNVMVVFTETGNKKNIKTITLDRNTIDQIPLGEARTITVTNETPLLDTTTTNTDSQDLSENSEDNPEVMAESKVEDDKTKDIKTPSSENGINIEDSYNPDDYDVSLNLVDQSPLMNNLLLGFDIGDLDGDEKLEVVYSAGMNIQVRSLESYAVQWIYEDFLPLSNDHKLIAVDLDGDFKDEVIAHGNLLEVVNINPYEDELISIQPRFLSRPVSLHGSRGITLFNKDSIYIVNYQGLVVKTYYLGEGYGKRFIFADLEGDGTEELITTMDGEDEGATIQIFEVDETLKDPVTLPDPYGFAMHAMDLNQNKRPEIYLRRNFFDGDKFLYSKIYVLESENDELKLIYESPKLDYFVVDFASYPKKKPNRLVVGGMYLNHKKQSINQIKSKLFFYNLD